MSKKPFHVVLTEAERDRLEAHRIALGMRSHADVVRHWVAQPPSRRAPPSMPPQVAEEMARSMYARGSDSRRKKEPKE